jgi:hypothetical protein
MSSRYTLIQGSIAAPAVVDPRGIPQTGGARTTAGTGPKIASDDPKKAEIDRKDPWPK